VGILEKNFSLGGKWSVHSGKWEEAWKRGGGGDDAWEEGPGAYFSTYMRFTTSTHLGGEGSHTALRGSHCTADLGGLGGVSPGGSHLGLPATTLPGFSLFLPGGYLPFHVYLTSMGLY